MAAAFVGGLGLLLALVLAMPGARSPLREPFVPKATRGEAVTIPLEVRESRKRTSVYRLALSVVDASVLLDHEELQLLFSSVPTRQELVRAELRARSRACLLEAAPADDLVDGQPVVFRRTGACSVERRRTAELDLTLELEGNGRLELLGFVPLTSSTPGPLQVPARQAPGLLSTCAGRSSITHSPRLASSCSTTCGDSRRERSGCGFRSPPESLSPWRAV